MALYELSDKEIATIEVAARFLRSSNTSEDPIELRRLEKLQPVKPVVAIYVEGGLVQGVRSSADIEVMVADLDNVEDACETLRGADRDIIGCACGPNVPQDDRDDHAETIDRYKKYQALTHAVL